jgi:hypothetical protein
MRNVATHTVLEARLAEVLMAALAPCDLGGDIEVVHDVESVEIEMDCALDEESDDHDAGDTFVDHDGLVMRFARELADEHAGTTRFVREHAEDVGSTTRFAREDVGTHQFVRHSAPYERIEIQVDRGAFLRATIEDAKTARKKRR